MIPFPLPHFLTFSRPLSPRSGSAAPPAFGWIWAFSALLAAVGLAAEYGFHEPFFPAHVLRVWFIVALGVFVISRIVLLFPASELSARLRHWWMDYLLLLTGGIWWAIQPPREPMVLRLGAAYVSAGAAGAAVYTCVSALVERIVTGRSSLWRIVLLLASLALAGGLILSLPACWTAPVIGQKWEQKAKHVLDCSFTAASAVTCTGLTAQEIGQDFTFAGQLAIAGLIQIGGVIALALGIASTSRCKSHAPAFLTHAHGEPPHSHDSHFTLMRWALRFMVVAELLGAAMMYAMWDGSKDAAFAATALPQAGGVSLSRVWFSVFAAISAFCNAGLLLSRDSLSTYGWQWQVYAAILPLMVLGSIGAPALHELWLRLRHGRTMTDASRVTVIGSLLLLVVGAILLFAVESTYRRQLRYPRTDTPGRFNVPVLSAPAAHAAGAAGSARWSSLDTVPRAGAALFESTAARTTGFRIVRLDEASISPATRWLLIVLMLIGGGAGGTAGGLRITTIWSAVRALLRRGRDCVPAGSALRTIAGMLLLTSATHLLLVYRDVGSFEASLMESVSACCNVGLSTGLTRQLYVEAKLGLIVAMLIGRAIPLALLAPVDTETE